MAIYRNVQLSFWTDNKVEDDFTPEDKYFYLYLLTNPQTNICGCYEVSYSQMTNQTGYNKDTINRLLDRFEKVHNIIRYCKETKEILILRGPDNDLNSKTFYDGITKTLDFSLFQDTHTQMIDNWDPEEAREYAMSLSDEVKNKIGYVIAANDDIGLEFHRGFNRTGYVMASHDNQKEKVKELCREFPNDTFILIKKHQ